MIMLGRFCGERPFLFAERSMPVPYIGDPDIKISDPHPGPTTRVLLDYRQVPCTTVCLPGLPAKNAGLPPQPDHTCFTRLSTSTMYDSLGPGTARQKNAGPPPQPDHTSFTRLPSTSTLRQFVRGDSPQKMTLGDSVNNRQGSFPFRFGI